MVGLKQDDLLILTADHGCDPTWKGYDHTREHVPFICWGPDLHLQSLGAQNLGIRTSFSDIGQTVAKHLKIAPLLFIILLENAFKHGVERLTNKAYIHIDLKTINDRIIFRIENNYEKMEKPSKDGIGLENLKKRLLLIYPNKHKLTIEDGKSDFKISLEIQTV